MNELFLVGGVVGSGKSTVASLIAQHGGAAVCQDDFRYVDGEYIFDPAKTGEVMRSCLKETTRLMKLRISPVVVHNTFLSPKRIRPYLELGKRLNYRVHVLTTQNYHNGESEHNVPDEDIMNQVRAFSPRLVPERLRNTVKIPSLSDALERLRTLPQRPDYHPEIWVYDHIAYVGGQVLMDTMWDKDDREQQILVWTAVMHDLAKWDTLGLNTQEGHKSYGAITSYGHAKFSAKHYCSQLLPQYLDDQDLIDDITWMVKYHMRIYQLQQNDSFSDHRLWPLLQRFSKFDDMVHLYETTTALDRRNYHHMFEQWLEPILADHALVQ